LWRGGGTIGFVLLVLTGLLPACEEEPTQMVYELKEPEIYNVYSEMIETRFAGKQYVVVQQETDTSVSSGMCEELRLSDTASVDEVVIQDYLTGNGESKNLGYYFGATPRVKLITREEFEAYQDWAGFHENYPEAGGILFFTLPGFNDDRTRALFEYTWRTGPADAVRYMIYLEHFRNEWHTRVHEEVLVP